MVLGKLDPNADFNAGRCSDDILITKRAAYKKISVRAGTLVGKTIHTQEETGTVEKPRVTKNPDNSRKHNRRSEKE